MTALNIKNIPDELYNLLKEKAEEDKRSINQEVIWLLQNGLLGEGKNVEELWTSVENRRTDLRKSRGEFSDSVDILRKDRGR